jgi:hypothetical protein
LLHHEFRWDVAGNWNKSDLTKLIDTGNDIEATVSNLTNGNGKGWMYSNLSDVLFVHSSISDLALSQLSSKGNQILGMTPIGLPLIIIATPGMTKQTIAHELAHVWDNSADNGLCASTWCGGGPADELAKFAGGNPSGVRWNNGTSEIPQNYQWQPFANGGYGNNSTADYFAESFAWMIYNPKYIPQKSILYWMAAIITMQ